MKISLALILSLAFVPVSGQDLRGKKAASQADDLVIEHTSPPADTAETGQRPAPECTPSERPSQATGAGRFVAVYCEPFSEKYQDAYDYLVENTYIDFLANDMNQYVAIPEDIHIAYFECGQPNAFYNPENRSITICYELYDMFEDMFSSAGFEGEALDRAVENAELFVFFHEVGHALISILDLPTTGREEDAVDQLATYIATDGIDPEDTAAVDAALGFYLWAQQREQTRSPMPLWDEHGLEAQRFFNILCWLYGERPNDYAHLVVQGILPESRAVRCAGEWDRLDVAWTTLLEDNIVFDPSAAPPEHASIRERLDVTMPAGYFDAHSDRNDVRLLQHWLPQGQTLEQWTDLLTIATYFGDQKTPQDLRTAMIEAWQSACPGSTVGPLADGDEHGRRFASWSQACPQSPITGGYEFTLFKAIRGADAMYLVQKAYRYKPDAEQLSWWVQFVGSVAVRSGS